MAIIGLGLMGGSLGLALKQRRLCEQVIGLVRRPEAASEAEAVGAVDWATLDPAAALAQADIVVFATPIRTIIRQLHQWADLFKAETIITDMGSTKQEILQAMASLPAGLRPIGSHPMCGKEQAGLTVAEPTLFEGAPWILSPLSRTPPAAQQAIKTLAEGVGAEPFILAPERHDRLVATISHLPYLLAATLTLTAQEVAAGDPRVWDVAASGFKDTSRLAASEETMMLDILLTNRRAVEYLLSLAQAKLTHLATALATNDEETLRSLIQQAAQQRRALYS